MKGIVLIVDAKKNKLKFPSEGGSRAASQDIKCYISVSNHDKSMRFVLFNCRILYLF